MAKDCRTTTRTLRRAFEEGKTLGIIERTRRGNQYVEASHHVFKLKHPEVHRTAEAVHRTLEASAPDSSVPLTSEEHLNNLTKDRKGLGEQGEPKPRWTRPVIYGERLRTSEDSYELEQVREAVFCSARLVATCRVKHINKQRD